jgi:HEAT repeat protein
VRRATLSALIFGTALLAGRADALVWPDVPDRIERALASPDPMARRGAAQQLSTLGVTRATPLVMKALGDADPEVRIAAAQSAIKLRVPHATEAVLAWLGDREARLRVAACEVARALPEPRAVAQLSRALGDADPAVRAAAADALGAHAHPDAVPPLLGKLDDASPAVRVQVARALAKLGDSRAVVPLVGKVQDSVSEVRQAVARALGELGDKRAAQALLLQLRDNSNDVRVEALQALGRLRAGEAVDAITPLALDRTSSLRRAALTALGRIGTSEAVRALIGALGAAEDSGGGLEHTPVRDALVAAGPTAANELAALLERPVTSAVATSAAWVIGELKATTKAPALVAAMRRGVLPTAAALHALAGAGTSDSIPVVLEFCGDPNPLVRAEALRAAGELLDPSRPDGRAVEPLAAVLRDARLSASERATVATLLGKTGAPRAAVVLTGMLNAKDSALVAAALDAIATVGPAGADAMLLEKLADPDPVIRLKASAALSEAGGARARDELLDKLGGSEELDRPGALAALGGILSRAPTEAAVAKLASALELAAGPERDAVIEALGRTKLPSALRVLLERTRESGPDDTRALASALAARAGERDAAAACKSLLDDADDSVRAQAAWSAGTLGDESFLPRLEALAKAPDIDAAIDATAAIGRIAGRLRSPQVASRVLCPLVADARPYVRANALTGLAAARARCGDGSPERRALAEDASEPVRAAAATVLANARSEEDTRALDRCASSDRSGGVAHKCRATLAPQPAEARAPAKLAHAVTIYVVADATSSPRPRAPYALQLADGYVRAGLADRRGALFEPVAPAGDVVLVRPSGVPAK